MDLKDTIKYITRYKYKDFMCYPNVVAVGCGNKYINNIDTGQLCIQVYVKEKFPKGYNTTGCVPHYYQGIPTDVIESGKIIAKNPKTLKKPNEVNSTRGFTQRLRPVIMGYNIGPFDLMADINTTSGCIVTRTNSPEDVQFFILATNHGLTDVERLPIGTPIVQPAGGGPVRNRIAVLSEYIPLKFTTPTSEPENLVDAALAKIEDKNLVRPKIAFMTIPKGINLNPSLGDSIKKSGGETGYTTGTIISESVSGLVDFEDKEAYFVDVISTTKISETGDSGAIVLDKDNKAIGMLFGDSSSVGLINKIDTLQNLLNVKIYVQN